MNGLDQIWLVILALAVVTGFIRFSFLGLLRGRQVPPRMKTALEFVPATVLPALVVPMILYAPRSEALTADQIAEPHRMLAGAFALIVGLASRNMVATVVAGMAAFVALRGAGF